MHTGLKRREVRKTRRAPDAEHWTVWCSPDLNPKSNAKWTSHRTRTTGRTSLRSVPIVRCLTLAGPDTNYTGRTESAFPVPQKPARDFSKRPTSAIENMHFIFSESVESRQACEAGGREEPIFSLPFKLHLLPKVCQHHNV